MTAEAELEHLRQENARLLAEKAKADLQWREEVRTRLDGLQQDVGTLKLSVANVALGFVQKHEISLLWEAHEKVKQKIEKLELLKAEIYGMAAVMVFVLEVGIRIVEFMHKK